MFIVRAILRARTECIVYFLLSSWLESLEHRGRSRSVPRLARQLPVHGSRDVRRRLSLVREKLDQSSTTAPAEMKDSKQPLQL